jgi:hypothetical protein
VTDQVKALSAVVTIGIVQVFFVAYGHLLGWPEPLISSILLVGLGLYTAVIVWLVRRVRARKAHPPPRIQTDAFFVCALNDLIFET